VLDTVHNWLLLALVILVCDPEEALCLVEKLV
jgi:hypothetical protein